MKSVLLAIAAVLMCGQAFAQVDISKKKYPDQVSEIVEKALKSGELTSQDMYIVHGPLRNAINISPINCSLGDDGDFGCWATAVERNETDKVANLVASKLVKNFARSQAAREAMVSDIGALYGSHHLYGQTEDFNCYADDSLKNFVCVNM